MNYKYNKTPDYLEAYLRLIGWNIDQIDTDRLVVLKDNIDKELIDREKDNDEI